MMFLRNLSVAALVLLYVCGCRPESYAAGRKSAAEQIKKIQLGSESRLNWAPMDLLEKAAKDESFVKNLRELGLKGNFDRYSNVSLSAFVSLERVTLRSTEQTDSYLEAMPPNIKTLILDQTDLTCGAGAALRLNDKAFVESWLQTIASFESVETIFVCPWNKRLTPIAVEILPKLPDLKQLDLEWASEEDVASLQKALPNCKVRLITEH